MEGTTASRAPEGTQEETPITIDLHVDVPWIMTKHRQFQLKDGSPHSKLSLAKMKKGGLTGMFCALYLSETRQDDIGAHNATLAIDRQIEWLLAGEGTSVVSTAESAERVSVWKSTPIFLGLEGGRLLGENLARLRRLRSLGVRYLTLTHNLNTTWADSATDKPHLRGLGKFGIQVVKECNEIGVFIDISHASDATAEVALALSTQPVLATHSGCRELVHHPRNLPDHLIREIARKGGVIGVPFAKRFIGGDWHHISNHIDHICQVTGSCSYAAIGSDLDGAEMVEGVFDVTDWKKVVMDELHARNYPDPDIYDIAGRNVLRLL